MRCFYHQDKEAVGTCRYCGKGLCPECAVDLGGGLACRNKCEEKARGLIQILDNNLRTLENPTRMQLVQTDTPPALKNAMDASVVSFRLANHIRATYRFRISTAAVYFAIGAILIAGGIARQILFLGLCGTCCLGFGVYTLIHARRSLPPTRPPESKAKPAPHATEK